MKNFAALKKFLVSWDLTPENEWGIPEKCFFKMLDEADRLQGEEFRRGVNRCIDATDGAFYLKYRSWEEVQKYWKSLKF